MGPLRIGEFINSATVSAGASVGEIVLLSDAAISFRWDARTLIIPTVATARAGNLRGLSRPVFNELARC